MSKNVQARRTSFWHSKIVVFLPIVIFLWIIGWTLTQFGSQRKPIKIIQKNLLREDDKESKITYIPEIVA